MKKIRPFIKKQHPDIPDIYGITLFYLDGTKEELKIASHAFLKDTKFFEYVTEDDFWSVVPFDSLKKISFDKNFSKMLALKTAEQQKKEVKNANQAPPILSK